MPGAVGLRERSRDGPDTRDDLPAGGQAGPEGNAGRPGPARAGVLRAPARPGRSESTGQLRHQRTSRLVAARLVHRGAHPGHHPGHLRLPAGQGIDGPLYMGKDTHALSGPAQRTALEVLAANGVETVIQRDDGVTPTPVISRAILVYNRGRNAAPRRRHRHHAVAQPARGRRLQVQPAQRRPGRHRRDAVDPGPGQRAAARRQRRREARAVRDGDQGGDDAPGRLRRCPTWSDLANVIDMEAIRGAGLKLGVDPLGGAAVALLGADQRGLRARHRRREPRDRSDLLLHDGRSRRQDPHGLLQPVRDGPAGRPEGSVSRRLRQRPRRGPARHRHAARRG